MASILEYDVDALDAHLIFALQLEDATHILDSAKGKSRANDVNDQDFAFRLLQQDLQRYADIERDRSYARSITRAIQTDHQIILEEVEAEKAAARDRRLASSLESQALSSSAAVPQEAECQDQVFEQDYFAKLTALYISELDGARLLSRDDNDVQDQHEEEVEEKQIGESSREGARSAHKARPRTRLCRICWDTKKFFEIARLPCNHEYCRDCLSTLFKSSLVDESLFPPRCCRQQIPLAGVRIFLDPQVAKDFEVKSPELSTPNRTYCSNLECSTWIPPSDISDDIAVCQKCEERTCTICKKSSHTGDCPEDEGLRQLLETARTNHWQRCYECKRVVDLNFGCNHITCRCGAQFCYVCGERWKECQCEQWQEGRLYARAEELLARDGNEPRPNIVDELPAEDAPAEAGNEPQAADDDLILAVAEDEPIIDDTVVIEEEPAAEEPEGLWASMIASSEGRQRRIADIMTHLQTNHDCSHLKWKYIGGPNQCEECSHFLPEYIFECKRCNIRACNRCRRNRL
ncbi:hypothetical protein FH972_024325 [Carpinus fangiana]|uniref:RBR-type E3 ubiquitin transferase n=1 Tax=Carpinus fangiana TaxID=176857 RepID=A0A5N6KXQ9_9ROSI|nr:hypothetical protein FH972_024325 [Carpinus fangiana]